MRKSSRPILTMLVASLIISVSGIAHAADLEKILRDNSDPRTFDIDTIDENFQGLSISEGQRIEVNRDQVADAVNDAKSKMTNYTLKKFQVISKTETAPFTSVVYEVESEFTIENTALTEKVVAHEIYEAKGDSYKLLYGAQLENLIKPL